MMPWFKTPKKLFFSIIGLAASIIWASPAAAMDTFFATPGAMGMGGANVAAVNDTSAQYYNPAAFGFFGLKNEEEERLEVDNNLGRKSWGLDIGASAGYRLLNDFGYYANILSDIDLEKLSSEIEGQSDLEDLFNLVGSLEGIAASNSSMLAEVTAGDGARAGDFALGGRGYFSAVGWVDELDSENLGLSKSGSDLAQTIRDTDVEGFTGDSEYQYKIFTAEQRSKLADALELDNNDDLTIQKIDYIAAKEGIKS